MSNRLVAYLLLFITSLIWGFAGPIIKYSLQFISPFEFLFWRFLLASLVSLPIMLWYYKKHPVKYTDFPKLAVLGFLGITLNLSLIFWGLSKTTVIEATLIGSLTPLLVVVASSFVLHERLTKRMRLGLGLAVAGSTLTILQPLIEKKAFSNFEGNVLMILGGFAWVGFVLLSKKWEHGGLKPFHIVSFSFFIGLVSFLLITLMLHGTDLSLAKIPQQTLLPIAYMAIFSSIIAYTAYEIALTKINASQADLFGYLAAIWAIPLAVFWLGEKFDITLLVSTTLITTGIFAAEYKKGIFTVRHQKATGYHLTHHK